MYSHPAIRVTFSAAQFPKFNLVSKPAHNINIGEQILHRECNMAKKLAVKPFTGLSHRNGNQQQDRW